MAITVDWPTKVITVPKADTVLVQSSPTEIRSLDINQFRLTLRDLEDGIDGMPWPQTHTHNPEVSVGGVTLARVVQIINDYTVTFEDGQYAVNLFGANSNVGDKVNVNQVSVRSANSAGLVTSTAIEYGEYGAQVFVDETYPTSGTVYPKGTRRDPVNNLTDAKIIAAARGFDHIQLIGNFTFDVADVLDSFVVHGQSISKSQITLTAAALITNCTFENASVTGTLDGGSSLTDCQIANLSYTNGNIHDCQLNAGVITLGPGEANFVNCWSGVAGEGSPIIDFDDQSVDLIMHNYAGGCTFRNKSVANPATIEMSQGQVVLEATITAGAISIRGIGKLTDMSVGADVNREIITHSDILLAVDHSRAANMQTQAI
jgi:hypothetical protein